MRGDPYARLALEVVLNNTFDGVVANRYAQTVAQQSGTPLTSDQWEEVGRDLIREDLALRRELVARGEGATALYLPVEQIKDSHQTAFGQNGLTLEAWTAWPPMSAAFQTGDLGQAQTIWNQMISGGPANVARTLRDGASNSLTWLERVGTLGGEIYSGAAPVDPISDPNFVRGYRYSPSDGSWYSVGFGFTGPAVDLAPPELAQQLNDERLRRIVASGQGVLDSLDARAIQGANGLATQANAAQVASTTANPIPADPARPGSSSWVTQTGAHTVVLNPPSGGFSGGLLDIVVSENARGNRITLNDLLTNNPQITNPNLVQAGQAIQVPVRNGDQLTLHYTNGLTVQTNRVNGEYSMIVPNTDGSGGVTLYERRVDGDAGYVVRQVVTDRNGDITFQSDGFQSTLDGPVVAFSATRRVEDGTYQTTALIGGNDVTFDVSHTASEGFQLDAIRSINDQPIATSGLTGEDLAAAGVSFSEIASSHLARTGVALVDSLSASGQRSNGWSVPQVVEVDLGNGLTARTIPTSSGLTITSVRNSSGQVVEIREEERVDGRDVTRTYNPDRELQNTRTSIVGSDGSRVDDIVYPDGSSVHQVRSADGQLVQSTGTAAPLQQIGTAIQDLNSLVNAIRSGQPLPILNSGLRLVNSLENPVVHGNQVVNDTPLFTTTAVVGAIASVYSLHQAFSGSGSDVDRVSAVANSVVAINAAANAVTNAAAGTVGEVASTALNGVANTVGQALPFVNAAIAISRGDYTGAAIAVAAYFVPVLGWIYAAYTLITSMGDEPPESWATARIRFANPGDVQLSRGPLLDEDGNEISGVTITVGTPGILQPGMTDVEVDIVGESLGPDRVRFLMEGNGGSFDGLLGYLRGVIESAQQANPGIPLGIIPQRLPTITWREARQADPGYAVVEIDPLTGEARYPELRYNDDFTPYNADPTDLAQRRDVFQRMVDSAIERQAIAPMWEVQTARMQQDIGDPNAGLTEEERAGRRGQAAPADANGERLSGEFRPVVLDLNGDNTITTVTDANSNVTFDWDDTGYVAQTGWVGSGEGILVLDRNLNGVADSGRELFSNGLVSNDARGVRSMAWVDANADGVINASDPVFNALRVWQDADQDGVQDNGETRTLSELGITSLDYGMSRFTRDGQFFAMGSPEIEASSEGVRVNLVEGGIQVDHSDGSSTLFVTQVNDAGGGSGQGTNFVVRDDSITSYEDGMSPDLPNASSPGANQSISITIAQLLANDRFNGSMAGLTITAVGNGEHGVAVLDIDQGVVTFTPEHHYAGQAGFEYTVTASDGQTRTARVTIDLQPVNDAPTVTVELPSRAVYGFGVLTTTRSVELGGDNGSVTEYTIHPNQGLPFYQPYTTVGGRLLEWIQTSSGDSESGHYAETGPVVDTTIPQGYFDREWARVTSSSQWNWDNPAPTYLDVNFNGQRYRIQGTPPTFLHDAPIATEAGNDGRLTSNDADGATQVSYSIVSAPLYGEATIDASTGSFTYTGRRYVEQDVQGTDVYQNVVTDDHTRAEGASPGYDTFVVRVTDLSDPSGNTFTTQTVTVPHYGPRPNPDVASGGKKPIALDLDGDGFEFIDVDDSNVFLTVNGEGWRRRTAWVGPDDGVLVFDENRNGSVDTIDELTFARYVSGAQTDLEGLRAFDTNGDGLFSAADDKWGDFNVWQDADSDGVVDAGEMRSLTDLGIQSVALASDGQFRVINGQTVHGTGVVARTDGSTLAMADVTLQYRNVTQITNDDGSTTHANVAPFAQGQRFSGADAADLVFGTSGSDEFVMAAGNDVVNDDGGNDMVQAGAGDDLVFTGADNDFVDAGSGNDSVFTGAGNDLAIGGAGDDVLTMEAGNDVAFGADGNDFVSGGAGNDLLSGDAGNDRLFGEGGRDQLLGGDGDDELWGLDGSDQLDGGIGNDMLSGGEGADTMDGGAGNDTYEVDSADDVVVEAAGGGEDTVRSNIDYTLSDALENLTLLGTAGLRGTGHAGANTLVGNDGANLLEGLAGNDTLDGGQGADTLAGGSGNDVYVVDNAGDRVVEAAGQGVDTVQSRITATLSANVENLALIGINAIDGTGNELDNVLAGNSAANTLDGGAGGDTMRGGRGNDSYVVDNAGDQVVEAVGEGYDRVTVNTLASYTLTYNVEALVLGAGVVEGRGNALHNVLTGNALANTLDGQAGDDAIDGGTGNDTLLGGSGDDDLGGGSGDDLLDGGSGADRLHGGAGDDTYEADNASDLVVENADEGYDRVLSSVSFALAANVETLELTGTADIDALGNAQDNQLIGNSGRNRLDGGAGGDTMAGGSGDDTYVVDDANDRVVEAADAGQDTVLTSLASYMLAAHAENASATSQADTALTGNAADNTLRGHTGNDTLDGAAGRDTLIGGAGDDAYVVDDVADTVVEQLGEGNDTVRASVNHTLTAHVEQLVLTGARAVDGTGNALSNRLSGNDADNRLFGLAGDDTLLGAGGDDLLDGGTGADAMAGGLGDDTYVVDDAGDAVFEAADQGTDTVLAGIDHALASNVENLILTGSGNARAVGNDLDNQLTGNAGQNRLDGGAGADTMAGGLGDDTYVVDHLGDRAIEEANAGIDTVETSLASYALGAGLEHLTGTASSGQALTGNAADNTLRGHTGNDTLDGGAGGDTMAGGSGDDTYIVDSDADRVQERADEGADTVQASVDHALAENVEHLVLTGAAVAGTGNALANTLVGNSEDNLLDGREGADTMSGGLGNDTYVVDDHADQVHERADQGVDTVLASIDHALAENVENLVLTGAAIAGTGNALDNRITGNAAANLLDGAAGADSMAGGEGDDGYVVENASDLVIEEAGAGFDRVSASIDYVLPQHVEQLTLTGTAQRGTGNDLDNLLFGNERANVLDGGAGADQMAGGAGDDRYVVDNEADTLIEAADAGNDTVIASVSHTLAAQVENLVLSGTQAIDGTGNELANVLVGNVAANRLDGGAGSDVLAGGQGHDTLEGGTGDDLYLYFQGEGRDLISDAAGADTLRFGPGMTLDSVAARMVRVDGQSRLFIAVLDADGEETEQGIELVLGADGSAPIERFEFADGQVASLSQLMVAPRTLYGSNRNDTLTGDRSDDTVYASNGNDVVYGRSGHDTLYGDNGADRLFGEGGNDRLYGGNEADEVWGGAGNDWLDGDNGRDLLVGGRGNDQLWGGNDADRLDGGAGNDLLDGNNGEDELYAGSGDDRLDSGNDADLLAAGDGNDVLSSGNGQDVLVAGAGNDIIVSDNDGDFIDAGAGNDRISSGNGADFIAAGRGNDVIDAGMDADVIAFNRGDGADTVMTSSWQRDTLSLGGGIRYEDLRLGRSGNDLVLDLGRGDGVIFRDWYLDETRRNLTTLQVVTGAAGGDYDAASGDRLRNRQVVSFNFERLVQRFDQARAANPQVASWALAGELDAAYLRGSDTQAIGGDLAYRYATSGSYGDLDWRAVRNRMPGVNGSNWQTLSASTAIDPWTALQAGLSLIADQTVGLPSPITPMPAPGQDELVFAAIGASGHTTAWRGDRPAPVLS